MRIKNFFCIIFLIQYFFVVNSDLLSNEWFTSASDYNSIKFSKIEKINKDNVNNLELAWIYKNGFVPDKNSPIRNNNQATPIFTGKKIISSSIDGFVIALNPQNGKEIWRTKIEYPAAKRGFTYFNGNIFIPSGKGIHVLNENDGTLNKNFGLDGLITNKKNFDSKSLVPPMVFKDKMIVAYIGSVVNHSLPSGNINWKVNLNGSRVWSGISYDEKNEKLVFVTSNLINLIGNTNVKDDYSNSIVVVDGKTGETNCKFKDTIHDHWDYDMVGNPIIVNSNNSNLAYGFSKTGNIFIVNIPECKLVNENSIQKIKTDSLSPIKNQTYSDYQIRINNPENLMDLKYDLKSYLNYISKDNKNLDYIKHRTRNSKFGESFIPLSLDYDPIIMGLHGGAEWPGGSYDLVNNQIIIPTNHYPWVLRSYYTCCLKNKPSALRKAQQILIDANHFTAQKIYKAKCSSCHQKRRNGIYESELFGDTYIPSLNGVTLTKKSESIKSLKNFKHSHKYTKNIEISDKELALLKEYFEAHDKYLKENNLLKLSATWQLLLDKYGDFASKPPYGKLTAFDLNTGKISWQIPFGEKLINNQIIEGDINFGGVLSTAGNISIATGTPDKNVYIFNSTNGEELWRTNLKFAGSSPPMTYLYKGEQYIIINSSGGRFYGYEKDFGDLIYAFKLIMR